MPEEIAADLKEETVESIHARWAREGSLPEADGDRWLGVAVRYRTDPERTRPFLAPLLDVDPLGEVQINFFLKINPPKFASIYFPGPGYAECDMHVGCVYKGNRCMMPLPWILDQDFGRYAGREGAQLRKKEGLVHLDVRNGVLHAAVTRRGKTMMRIRAPISKEPAHPLFWFREVGWGELRTDYRLNCDWRKGVLDDGPVELWHHHGSDHGYPTGMPDPETWDRCPRKLDPRTIELDLGDASALDPYCELPVLEILGGSGSLGPTLLPNIAVPRGPNRTPAKRQREADSERVNLGSIDKSNLEPLAWIWKAYDPPIFRGKTYQPAGWPKKGSVTAQPASVIEQYRKREAIVIGPAQVLDLTCALEPALHARTAPAPFVAGRLPRIRFIAMSVEVSDVSTVPYGEIWLLSACEHAGEPAWLALSNIVTHGGDVLAGREVWGNPQSSVS